MQDNTALFQATQRSLALIPVFVIDPALLQRRDTSPGRVSFMLDSLRELAQGYARLGGSLVIRRGDPALVLPQIAQEFSCQQVFWNEDIEPFARQRDHRVKTALEAMGVAVSIAQDMLLHAPGTVLSQAGQPYSVYTPFWRNWIVQSKADPYPAPERLELLALDPCAIPSLADLGLVCDQTLPLAGEQAGLDLLEQFCSGSGIRDYQEQRNLPAQPGTSSLSPHLRWGTVGIRHVWRATVEVDADLTSDEAVASLQTWRQELAWREFYKQVLFHWPEVETQPFRSRFAAFEWDNHPELFSAWCSGSTGYPIVDAAMRQLNQTGWMHNRCRMIVASFLTKDLLIDWRWGELYFMQHLVDGDLAANNGGWQWSASVGTDPKPLRIFNPMTQAANYDPEADYIRAWVPELAGLEASEILNISRLSPAERRSYGYPAPIVDHKQRQQEFKRRYQALSSS